MFYPVSIQPQNFCKITGDIKSQVPVTFYVECPDGKFNIMIFSGDDALRNYFTNTNDDRLESSQCDMVYSACIEFVPCVDNKKWHLILENRSNNSICVYYDITDITHNFYSDSYTGEIPKGVVKEEKHNGI